MTTSVFTKMIKGEYPCYKVFEDEWTFAFLARETLQEGHTLIVPKIEIDNYLDLPEPYYSKIFSNSKLLAKAIQQVTNCKRVGTVTGGWDIPHFHYHLVPMYNFDDLDPRKAKQRTKEEYLEMQNKIVNALTI